MPPPRIREEDLKDITPPPQISDADLQGALQGILGTDALLDSLNTLLDQEELAEKKQGLVHISQVAPIFIEAAEKYGVDPVDTMSMALAESGKTADGSASFKGPYLDLNARSPVGAKGVMQLMDSTATEMGVTDPYDIVQNVDGGTKYYALQLRASGGDKNEARARYNFGPGNVEKKRPLPKETRDYQKRVAGNAPFVSQLIADVSGASFGNLLSQVASINSGSPQIPTGDTALDRQLRQLYFQEVGMQEPPPLESEGKGFLDIVGDILAAPSVLAGKIYEAGAPPREKFVIQRMKELGARPTLSAILQQAHGTPAAFAEIVESPLDPLTYVAGYAGGKVLGGLAKLGGKAVGRFLGRGAGAAAGEAAGAAPRLGPGPKVLLLPPKGGTSFVSQLGKPATGQLGEQLNLGLGYATRPSATASAGKLGRQLSLFPEPVPSGTRFTVNPRPGLKYPKRTGQLSLGLPQTAARRQPLLDVRGLVGKGEPLPSSASPIDPSKYRFMQGRWWKRTRTGYVRPSTEEIRKLSNQNLSQPSLFQQTTKRPPPKPAPKAPRPKKAKPLKVHRRANAAERALAKQTGKERVIYTNRATKDKLLAKFGDANVRADLVRPEEDVWAFRVEPQRPSLTLEEIGELARKAQARGGKKGLKITQRGNVIRFGGLPVRGEATRPTNFPTSDLAAYQKLLAEARAILSRKK